MEGDNLNGKILGAMDQVGNFTSGISLRSDPYIILDILLVTTIIYWIYILIKETRAMRIMYGIALLALLMLVGQVFQLSALNFILKYLVTMILVAIPIVFQPELRSALERLGRTRIVGDFAHLKRSEILVVVEDIVKAAKAFTKNKTGALIVLAQKTGLKEFIDTGRQIDAKVSKELLMTIFTPGSPLHDGAVIISGNKIIAASCMLPLSDNEFEYSVGTRHRAAVGLSAQTDAIVVVVSEEKRTISISYNGQLSRELSPKELEDFLLDLLQRKTVGELRKEGSQIKHYKLKGK